MFLINNNKLYCDFWAHQHTGHVTRPQDDKNNINIKFKVLNFNKIATFGHTSILVMTAVGCLLCLPSALYAFTDTLV